MDGMMVPAVGQVTLLDSHNLKTVDDVLGHVRDFIESYAGQYPARGGRIFAGPLKVSYSWLLKEFSVTPVGADVLAKVRTLCGGGR